MWTFFNWYLASCMKLPLVQYTLLHKLRLVLQIALVLFNRWTIEWITGNQCCCYLQAHSFTITICRSFLSFYLEYHCSQPTRRILLCCLLGRVIAERMTVWRDASDPLSQSHSINCVINIKIMNLGRKSSFMTGFLTFIQTNSFLYVSLI